MKKLIYIIALFLSTFAYSQISGKLIPDGSIPVAKIIGGVGGGESNPNIVIVTTEAALYNVANANKILDIQSNVTLTANRTLASNVTLSFSTGSINLNGYDLDFNNGSVVFNGKRLGINAFTGKLKGAVKLHNKIVYASNFGLIDDNIETTDNNNAGNNALHCVNQNSGHLIFNKQTTGHYYTMPHPSDPEGAGNAFFPNNYTQAWAIGKGYDGVTVELEGDVEIKSIRNDKTNSCIFMWFDTKNSTLKGGTLRGDRYVHRYNRVITVGTGATSSNNVNLVIQESDNFNSSVITNTINVNIPITNSNSNTNATQIKNYINSNLTGFVATSLNNVVTFYKEGSDFSFTIDPLSTGASFTTEISSYEWGYGLDVFSLSIFNTLKDIRLLEFHGDGLAGGGQGNGQPWIEFSDLTQGFIDTSGTITANTGYYYSDIRELPDPHEWFSLASNAMASVDLLHFKYWVLYYDSSNNFLGKSKSLIPYERYQPRVYKDGRAEVAKYRILVESNGTNINSFFYFVNSRSYALGNTYENVEIAYNRRQGASNPGIDFAFINCWIHDTGGAEPQYGIDVEDDHKHPMGWKIIGCHFWNNANGDIILKGASNGLIQGNFFKQDSWNLRIGDDQKGNAISTGYSRKITITENFFEHKIIGLDIGTIFSNNQLFYSDIYANAGGSLISNNIFENGSVNDGSASNSFNSESAGGSSMNFVNDNIFKISDNWGNRAFIDEANSIVWKNNTYLFNDKTSNHGVLNDESLRTVFVNNTGSNMIRSQRTTTNDEVHKGTTLIETVLGLKVNTSNLHTNGWTKYCNDLKDFNIESSLIFDYGFKKSFKVERGKTKGWVDFKLTEFPSDGIGAFETIIVKDVDIYIPARIDANNGYLVNHGLGSEFGVSWTRVLSIAQDKNVNFEFINCRIISDDLATTRFAYMGHRGTTLFKDCYFATAAANTVNFTARGEQGTSTNFRSTNNGVITMIGNRTNGNVTFTMDTGDIKIDY